MFRQIPVQSKICFQREHERNVMMHDIKIRDMKKMIDNEAPTQYDFLVSRKKKEALQQSRGNEIQRENKILIQKLTQIMNRNQISGSQSQQNLHGSVYGSSQFSIVNPFNSTKNSLNKALRKKEFVKIVIENQALLKRIQTQKSEYNVRLWEKERVKNERYISQISEYQYKDFKPNKTIIKTGIWNDQSQNKSQQSKRPTATAKLQPLFKNKNQQRIIYKNGRKIGSYIYLVEIKVQKGYFFINLENLQKQQNQYKIELSEQEGMNMLINECNNDPELLIERIRIDEKTKSFYFKRNMSLKSQNDSMNNQSDVQKPHEIQKAQQTHQNPGQNQNPNQTQPKNKQLRVTEEKDEEEEQSIIKSNVDMNTKKNDHTQNHNQSSKENSNQKQTNQDNSKQNTSRNDSKQNTPRNDSKKGSPHNDSKQDSPHNDSKQDSPHNYSKQDSPRNDSKQDSPRNDSKQNSPRQDSQQNSPHNDSKQDSPRNDSKQSKQGSPRNDCKQGSPRNESKQGSPRNDSKQDSPRNESEIKEEKKKEEDNNDQQEEYEEENEDQ